MSKNVVFSYRFFNAKSINIKSSLIEGSSSENFLSITIEVTTFEKHINELCRKSNLKLHALTRSSKFMKTGKKRLIFKVFIIWQFNYCPLVQMHSLHKKLLNVTQEDRNSYFSGLLNLDKSVSIDNEIKDIY